MRKQSVSMVLVLAGLVLMPWFQWRGASVAAQELRVDPAQQTLVRPPAALQAGSIQAIAALGPPYPPRINWKLISTPQHRLIFPSGFEAEAQRVAQLTYRLQRPIQSDFGREVPQLPLILNTTRQVSNGYVTLAPRHSEWYAYNSQGQFAGPVDWYTLLALHEGRHAAQFSALNRGFTRFARWAAGEYGWGFFAMYSMPLWYFEGDAILSETVFSSGGRGRSAAFHRELRAIADSEREVSYGQAYLGSYRAHFPNHYYLGFPLVTYLRLTYGEDVWNEIIEKTARFSFWPLRFHTAVTQVTGSSVRQVYRDMLIFIDTYFDEYQAAAGGIGYFRGDPVQAAAGTGDGWTNYLPVAAEAGQLYTVRFGARHPAALVQLDLQSSQERTLTYLGAERQVSVQSGVAVWSEEVPHPLWSKVSSSEIIRFELDSGRRRRLTFGGAYQAPVLSPDAGRIAAVRALAGGGGRLELLDAGNGQVLRSLVSPPAGLSAGGVESDDGPLYLRQPAWSPDAAKIVVVAVQGGRSRLMEYDVSSKSWRTLSEPVGYSISSPVYAGSGGGEQYVVYVSERSGTELVEAVSRPGNGDGGELFQVAGGRYAAGYPVIASGPEGERLYYAEYTVDGFKPMVLQLQPEQWHSVDNGQGRDAAEAAAIAYVEPIARRWAGSKLVAEAGAGAAENTGESAASADTADSVEFEVEEYRPLTGLLNVHSWGLLPDIEGRVQLFAQSDDVLGRLSLNSFVGVNIRKDRYDAGVQGSFRGMFPIIRFGVSGDTNSPGDPDARWNGMTALLGLDAPLDFSRGVWFRQLRFSTTGFLRYEQADPLASGDRDAYVLPLRHALSWYSALMAKAPADFAPRWEHYLEGSYQYVPAPAGEWGSRIGLNGLLTTPGLGRQHRLQLGWTGELKSGEAVPLTSPPVRPRGYPFGWNDEYAADGVASLQYSLPLLYPDMELGNVYFLKRIRGTLFADLGIGVPVGAAEGTGAGLLPAGEEPPQWLQELDAAAGADLHPAAGFELLFEQHLFNWPIALEAGLRFVYSWRDARFRVEDTLLLLGMEW
jgi:hypothetical protein